MRTGRQQIGVPSENGKNHTLRIDEGGFGSNGTETTLSDSQNPMDVAPSPSSRLLRKIKDVILHE
jgi:hypothetical protein